MAATPNTAGVTPAIGGGGGTSVLGSMFGGGGIGQQLLVWGVLSQVLGAVLQPIMEQLSDEIWPRLTSGRLSPQEAADLVLKGWWDHQTGADEAAATGISADRFKQLVNSSGDSLGSDQLLEALRRNILVEDKGKGAGVSFMEGVRQSRIRDEWAPVLQELQWVPLPAADAVNAVVENQIDYATGEAEALKNGIPKDIFRVLVNTRGNPPGPETLLEMHRRGFIPMDGRGPAAISVEQGIYEGATKDKWYPYIAKLTDYFPPPRTITALERSGSITPEQATRMYQEAGLTPELAAIYSHNASMVKLAKHKEIAESTVLQLYENHVVPQSEAAALLATLGYDNQEAQWLLTLGDVKRSLKAINSVTSRIGALYVARKMTQNDAINALNKLGLPSDQVNLLITDWNLEREAEVKVLTEAQVASALYYKVIDMPTATHYLVELGYTEYDAWVLLSARLHGPVGKAPASGGNVGGKAQ